MVNRSKNERVARVIGEKFVPGEDVHGEVGQEGEWYVCQACPC